MARQRFIWPEIWKDPVFGRLQPDEQIMFIGLFSIADDEGRLHADPAYLRSELFAYKDYSEKKVKGVRDSVVAKCRSVQLYTIESVEFIALLKWSDYQKPKYAKPSKIEKPPPIVPPTLGEASPKPSGSLPKNSSMGWVGLDRDGMDREGPCAEQPTSEEPLAEGTAPVFNIAQAAREFTDKLKESA